MSNLEKLVELANHLRNASVRMMRAGATLRDKTGVRVRNSARRQINKQLTAAQAAIEAIRTTLGGTK